MQEIFARRLQTYYASTSPLLAYYASQSSSSSPSANANATQLVALTGATSDEIWSKLEGVLNAAFPSLKKRGESREERRRHSLSDAVRAREVEGKEVGVEGVSQ